MLLSPLAPARFKCISLEFKIKQFHSNVGFSLYIILIDLTKIIYRVEVITCGSDGKIDKKKHLITISFYMVKYWNLRKNVTDNFFPNFKSLINT